MKLLVVAVPCRSLQQRKRLLLSTAAVQWRTLSLQQRQQQLIPGQGRRRGRQQQAPQVQGLRARQQQQQRVASMLSWRVQRVRSRRHGTAATGGAS